MIPKSVFLALGLVSVGLGALGLVLPFVPTTPFLLLAAACFARSSEKLHSRLLENRTFGPHIRRWEEDRSMSSGAKFLALFSIVAGGGIAVYRAKKVRTKVLITSLLVIPVAVILSIKTSDSKQILKKPSPLD